MNSPKVRPTEVELARRVITHGVLKDRPKDIQKRLLNFLNNPTPETWDDAFSIVLTGNMIGGTFWQRVLRHDPSFPRKARGTDNVLVNEWERIPTQWHAVIVLVDLQSLYGEWDKGPNGHKHLTNKCGWAYGRLATRPVTHGDKTTE